MDIARKTDDAQTPLWNGTAGQAWVDIQELLDQILEPFEERLADGAFTGTAAHVLDVGCGTGATTLALARRLGPGGAAVGVDISAPMLARARARAAQAGSPATFIEADAQRHAFTPARFDFVLSRFGVMFFDDPVAAFANLRSAAKRGARLRFIAWRSPEENAFMTTAERAAAPLVAIPPRQPDAPGQFAFAERARVAAILAASGWADVDIQPYDVVCTLPTVELPRYFTRLGPLGRLIQALDEPDRDRVIATVRAAFDGFVHGAEVRFNAACWLVDAVAP